MKKLETIYIKGIKKYNVSLYKGLRKSKLVEGVDYVIGLGGIDYALYWIDSDKITLKDFKLAVGAKYVWKHRMRFFTDINDVTPKISQDGLSQNDVELMSRVKDSIYKR